MSFRTGDKFPQGRQLAELIAKTGWSLYDMSEIPSGQAPSWKKINRQKPSTEFKIGANYLFVPTPTGGQLPRDAYATTNGVGPSLRIVDPDNGRWASLEVYAPHRIAVFTRLIFDEEFLVAMSPNDGHFRDFVAIRYDDAIDTFTDCFGIVTLEGYLEGVQRPVDDFASVQA